MQLGAGEIGSRQLHFAEVEAREVEAGEVGAWFEYTALHDDCVHRRDCRARRVSGWRWHRSGNRWQGRRR